MINPETSVISQVIEMLCYRCLKISCCWSLLQNRLWALLALQWSCTIFPGLNQLYISCHIDNFCIIAIASNNDKTGGSQIT